MPQVTNSAFDPHDTSIVQADNKHIKEIKFNILRYNYFRFPKTHTRLKREQSVIDKYLTLRILDINKEPQPKKIRTQTKKIFEMKLKHKGCRIKSKWTKTLVYSYLLNYEDVFVSDREINSVRENQMACLQK